MGGYQHQLITSSLVTSAHVYATKMSIWVVGSSTHSHIGATTTSLPIFLLKIQAHQECKPIGRLMFIPHVVGTRGMLKIGVHHAFLASEEDCI